MDSFYFEVPPHPSLSSYIETYWVMEVPTTVLAFPQMVIPDHCMDLIFDLGQSTFESFGKAGSKIIGVMTTAMGSVVKPGNKLLGIRFKPFGASAVFGISAGDLMDQSVNVSDLCRDEYNIRDRLLSFDNSSSQIQFLNSFFISRQRFFRPIHLATTKAVSIVARSGGSVSVATLADTLGLTRRHLARSFVEHIGLSPKEFLRIERFRAIIKVIDSAISQPDWCSLALEYGFYDQAHFVSDFSRIMGTPPHRYWKKSA